MTISLTTRPLAWAFPFAAAALLFAAAPAAAQKYNDARGLVGKINPRIAEEDERYNHPGSPKADPKVLAKLNEAVGALAREYRSNVNDAPAYLRARCNYFKPDERAAFPIDAVLSTLERVNGGDPATDAYVKWQLLSALGEKVSGKAGERLLNLYRRSPQLLRHPGLPHASLDAQAQVKAGPGSAKPPPPAGGEAELNKVLQARVDAFTKANAPLLHWRDEALTRLPASAETFLAALDDLGERVNKGVPAGEFATHLTVAVRGWGGEISAAKVTQLKAMSDAIRRIKSAAAVEANRPHARAEPAGTAGGGPRWVSGEVVPAAALDDLEQAIDEAKAKGHAR